MSSDRAPPERPAEPADAQSETSETDRHNPLSSIETRPGDRRTDSVTMLVVEAELAHEGTVLDNPAKPRTESVGETYRERLDEHDDDLVPAWTRPWETEDRE